MRISDWSSDVCSSDLNAALRGPGRTAGVDQHRDIRIFVRIGYGIFASENVVEALEVQSFGRERRVAPLDDGVDQRQLVFDYDRKSTRLNSSPSCAPRMPSSA